MAFILALAIGIPQLVIGGSAAEKVDFIVCPIGEVAIGGGYILGRSPFGPLPVAASHNHAAVGSSGTPIGWTVRAFEVIPFDDH